MRFTLKKKEGKIEFYINMLYLIFLFITNFLKMPKIQFIIKCMIVHLKTNLLLFSPLNYIYVEFVLDLLI